MDPAVAPAPVRRESDDARLTRLAVRELEGTATVADASTRTGLDFDRTESALKELLELYRGHVAVGESGDVVYSFDPRLIRRDHVSLITRVSSAVRAGLATAFKVWIMLMLVVYFVLFLVLAVAMVVGVSVQGGGGRGRSRRGGGVPISIFDWFWAPRWGVRRPYYGRRHEVKRELRIPFYKKIFAYVFGPDDPNLTAEDRDQEILQLVRARRGVLAAPELVELTGQPLHEAEEELGRVVGRFAGEPQVSEKGELLYAFPDLMLSAHGPVTVEEPVPTWRKLERPKELTGNGKSTDGIITALNGFNLVMAASSPVMLMPRLGFSGPLADFALFQMPLVFSALFFAVPAVRAVGLAKENAGRWTRNVRRGVIGHVYRATLDRGAPVTVDGAWTEVRKFLRERTAERGEVEQALHALASEFDADVEAAPDGPLSFQFPALHRAFLAAAERRADLQLEARSVGEIVYSSADTQEEATRRELRNFDREIRGYVAPPRRVRHLDDYEVAEFDRMLAAAQRSGRFLRPSRRPTTAPDDVSRRPEGPDAPPPQR